MDLHFNPTGLQTEEAFPHFTELSVEGIDGLIHVREVQALLSDRFEMRLVWDNLPLSQYKQLIKLMYDQKEDIMEQFKYSGGANIFSSLLRSAKFYLGRKPRRYKRKRVPFDQSNDTISS
ncbi:hypothetical protein GCM10025859_49810 [Alicyclobacillus fastidiosus]|nr:hypothetical protein GCM10025859_49810 [Alicyclobacillus fastidiosus]